MSGSKYYTMLESCQAFNSIELREEDKEYVTFTTQWGYYRYRRAPQGFFCSADAYNMRLNEILKNMNMFTKDA